MKPISPSSYINEANFIKILESLENKTLGIDEWYQVAQISPRMIAKLKEFDFQTIMFHDDYRQPATLTTGKGDEYRVFFVTDIMTTGFVNMNYLDWIDANLDDIKQDKVKFLYVEDTKNKRIIKGLENRGLKDHIIQRLSEKTFPREEMIARMQEMFDEIPNLDLPARVDEIRAFGSLLRNKPRVPDVDLLIKISYSLEDDIRLGLIDIRLGENWRLRQVMKSGLNQKTQKNQDVINLNAFRIDEWTEQGRQNFNFLVDRIDEASKKYKTLRDIINHENDIREKLELINYPIDWFLHSVTLSKIGGSWDRNSLVPEPEQIISRMIKKGHQGFRHILFGDVKAVKATENNLLVWSSKYPDVKANIDGRTKEEVMQFLIREFDRLHHEVEHFHEDSMTGTLPYSIEPRACRVGTETEEELRDKVEIIRQQLREIEYKGKHALLPENSS